jgi:hypothetical protein
MALKQQLVARLTGVNALSAAQLARETGITQQNLSRSLSEARSSPFFDRIRRVPLGAYTPRQIAMHGAATCPRGSQESSSWSQTSRVKARESRLP